MSIERLRLRIVGLPFHEAQNLWDACEAGMVTSMVSLTPDKMIPIELRPEPTNKNDPNAIQVYLDPAATGGRDHKLGYVPRQDAAAIHALMSGAGHLGAAIDISEIDEPVERSMWRALIETDRPDLAAGQFKKKDTIPASYGSCWRNQALTAAAAPQTPSGKAAARPRSRKRLHHSWF